MYKLAEDDWDLDREPAPRPVAQDRIDAMLKGLTPEQEASVLHRGSPLVILAGAGTGKTTALTRRIGHIIASGDARPHEVLAVTFTNKAARELENRLTKLLDGDTNGLTVGTFHAICARLLRDNHSLFNIPSEYTILDSDDQSRMIKRLIRAEFGKDTDKEFFEGCKEYIEEFRNNPDQAVALSGRTDWRVRRIEEIYREQKIKDGSLDFTDLISVVVDAFEDGSVSWSEITGRWTHILVDEYQDTNNLQFRWLQYVAHGKPNLAVVGDDDQVLYSWRGARIENMLEFADQFKGTKIIRLEQNFRSTGHILDAANGLIARNKRRLGKTLVTDAGKGQQVHVRYFANADLEARWIVEEIRLAIAEGMDPQDIAVLSRSSRALNLVEQKLSWAGIPYVLSGGKRFQDRKEIKDAMAYLRLAMNPNDTVAFERIVNTPKRGVGDVSVKKMIEASAHAKKLKLPGTLMDIIANFANSRVLPGEVPAKLSNFVNIMTRASAAYWRNMKAGALLEQLLDESGYQAEIERLLQEAQEDGDAGKVDQQRAQRENLADLLLQGAELTPHEFLEQMGLAGGGDDNRGKNASGVWLGTIHAAKGLEFPMVIGVAWEDQILPSWQALQEKGDMLAEERRCAYVMMTRARRMLTLTTTGERYNAPAIASRFLNELPEGCMTRFDMQPEDGEPQEDHPSATAQPDAKSEGLQVVRRDDDLSFFGINMSD